MDWKTPARQKALLSLVNLWFNEEVYHKTKILKADKLKTVTSKFSEKFKMPNGSDVITNALEKKMDTFSDFVKSKYALDKEGSNLSALPSHADPMNPESEKVMITMLKITSKEVADKLELS